MNGTFFTRRVALFATLAALFVCATSGLCSDANSADAWRETTPGARRTLDVCGVECAFRYCPPGEFVMGSPTSERDRDADETQFAVELTQGFWTLETEATQRLWRAVTGEDPSYFKGDDQPVETVSWDDCVAFVAELNARGLAPNGWEFRLPTEAQWEYACRAGEVGAYDPGGGGACAWFAGNSGSRAREVGLKRPNAWGIYDMHGNVYEWTLDFYGAYPTTRQVDPVGPATGFCRVSRGGGWIADPQFSRSANRSENSRYFKSDYQGFRPVLAPK